MNRKAKTEDDAYAEDGKWSKLARKSQEGDCKSYSKLLHAITPYIQKILFNSVSSADWVEEITQEVLLSVHKSLHTYSTDMPFKPWLKAIIHYRKTDYLRKYYKNKERKQAVKEQVDIDQSGVTKPVHAGEYKDIEAALLSLPEKQRRVFKMIKLEGHSIKDVAERMNMSESAVKVSAHRSAKQLQKRLQA